MGKKSVYKDQDTFDFVTPINQIRKERRKFSASISLWRNFSASISLCSTHMFHKHIFLEQSNISLQYGLVDCTF